MVLIKKTISKKNILKSFTKEITKNLHLNICGDLKKYDGEAFNNDMK